jgi:tetratricopeptide (TPR) repeat protein
MMGPSGNKPSFWTTLPGILTGIAAVIGAITGLLAATGHYPLQFNTSQPPTSAVNNKNITTRDNPPVAYAVSQSNVKEGEGPVYLNGSGQDPDGDKVTYLWKQIYGAPKVRIFNQTSPVASFVAPSNLTQDRNLTFELTVYDNRGMEDRTNVTVLVLNDRNNDAQLFIKDGWNLFTLGRNTEAIDAYNKSLAIDPNNTLAMDDKAGALINLGRYTEADNIENKSLDINPKDTIALNNKAAILYGLGNYSGALTYYDKSLSIEPNNAWTLNRKGLTLYNLGNYTEAIDAYDKSLSIEPNNADVKANKDSAMDALKNTR